MFAGKKVVLGVALGLSSVVGVRPATAQQIAPMLRQKVALDTKTTDPNEALWDVARATKTNLIADATHWKNDENAKPIEFPAYRETGALISYLLELSDARGLSWAQPDSKTFLFWQQPEETDLMTRIAAGEDVRLPLEPIEAKIWQDAWLKYLREVEAASPAKGAPVQAERNTNLAPSVLQIRVKDLPLGLRAPVTRLIQNHLLDSPFARNDRKALTDEFWQSAAVGLRVQGDSPVARLVLISQDAGSISYSSVDPILLPNPANKAARPNR